MLLTSVCVPAACLLPACCRWDEQNSLLVESHERVIAELTEDYEAKLAEEALKIEALQAEKVGPGGKREGWGRAGGVAERWVWVF